MASQHFIGQLLGPDANITANGSVSFSFPVEGYNTCVLNISIDAAPTGTSPTITFQVQVSEDGGVVYENIGTSTAALSAAGLTQLSVSNIPAGNCKLVYTLGGTSPAFPKVTVNAFAQ